MNRLDIAHRYSQGANERLFEKAVWEVENHTAEKAARRRKIGAALFVVFMVGMLGVVVWISFSV